MKKTVALFMAILVCLSLSVLFTACDEEEVAHTEHTYATEWSSDKTHHWHACTEPGCTETSDKAEHTWDEGVISLSDESKTQGTREMTCTVCKATKQDTLELDERWTKMLEMLKTDNYTLDYTQTMRFSEEDTEGVRDDATLKFTKEKTYYSQTVYEGDKSEETSSVYTGDEAKAFKDNTLTVILNFLNDFDQFTFDEEKQAYTVEEPFGIPYDNLYGFKQLFTLSEDATVTVDENGYLKKFVCVYTQQVWYDETRSDTFFVTTVFSLFDYGTTVVEDTAE